MAPPITKHASPLLRSVQADSEMDLQAAKRAYDRVLDPKRATAAAAQPDALLASLRTDQAKKDGIA